MSQSVEQHVSPWRRAARLVAVVAGLAAVALPAPAGPHTVPAQAAPAGALLGVRSPGAIPGEFVVVLDDAAPSRLDARAGGLAREFSGTVLRTFEHAVPGFSVAMSTADARRLSRDPSVAYVEANQRVSVQDVQSPTPSWGLDRADQRALPLDTSFTYPNTGAGVTAYVIDTGIRVSHQDFEDRAVSGTDVVDGDADAADCNGHGTHVAGTLGGEDHGVAKDVSLVGVRVLDCAGDGTTEDVIAGIDWVTAHHRPGEPAVANVSLGGGFSQAVNDAVSASIADGITYAVAAGNDTGVDACTRSPASAPAALTVGATTSTDARAPYSNIGACLDLFAPGTSITSAWHDADTATGTINGTSMATPHVTGAAALYLAANPSLTPAEVSSALLDAATPGVVTQAGAGSPNRLLFTGDVPPPTQDFAVSVENPEGIVQAGSSVAVAVSTRTTLGDPQQVTLSAHGLPGGVTASFDPATITSGQASTLTLTTTASAPPGTYALQVRARGATWHTTTYRLTVAGPPGCSQTNGSDVPIRDNATVTSVVSVTGCDATPSATARVAVAIRHTYVGDLYVDLIAPSGTTYRLHSGTGGGADNIDTTYTVDLSRETASGPWRLRVRDTQTGDSGHIDSWTLDLDPPNGPPAICDGENTTDVPIPDNATVNSPITLSNCPRGASASSQVHVDITHPYRGDLVVRLIAPDGTVYPLLDKTGGGADDVHQTFTVNLAAEPVDGTWNLRVQDTAAGDTGTLTGWSLAP
ncbi:proprotein convertase P-domain-containing protein [Myceligenerans pegani]|uniref:Proprotein convertase P-domain-containing protein n=1 Tax=Myceligenerans pegani TaxID=2776917 RepID=A0ABR9MZP0_9MICO|nr:S8 family serine peptidase [Myceligenerans sp. TRM 65318]MBE1876859.1 proprotein convertase P-domain-containing protein [Myceligenerans sp. TRM 65318]MBE3019130.1 proprotein convertase P-domain-containing protein [Myceligenerans sp. TRM 65318]